MWNKITVLMVLAGLASLLFAPIQLDARGGGRGGGGGGRGGGGGGRGGGRSAGGGGAYRGGKTMNRTPSMSRASSRPAVSQPGRQSQLRPSISQGSGQPSRQTFQQRPSAANHAELRNQVNRYAQNRPSQGIDRQFLANKTQDFSNQRNRQINQNRQLSDRVSNRLQQSRPDSKHWFDRNFFESHHIDVDYAGQGANWWRPAAWATLATWGAWQWSTPYYYDDGGDAYPLAYSTIAMPSQPQQEQPVQDRQTSASSAGGDWLPLGVFAMASNATAAAQTNRFIQLAINRSGEIAGVFYNSATDAAQDLTGMVDSNNQKVYWSLDNWIDSPIASTGIYNLTEDQTSINVHFADGSDQTWVLVRLQGV